MKKSKKVLLTMLSAAALMVTTVFGTVAYFQDIDSQANTFTVGRVQIELDESDVKADGTYEHNDDGSLKARVKKNEYHLIPGQTYTKDPVVHVKEDSANAYVRMLVHVKRIDQLRAALPKTDKNDKPIQEHEKYYADDLFLIQMLCNGWDKDTWVYKGYKEIDENPGKTGIYEFRYVKNETNNAGEPVKNEVVVESDEDTNLPALFTSITVPGEIDNAHLAYLKDVQIVVKAHAIQADGFETADAAWSVSAEQFADR